MQVGEGMMDGISAWPAHGKRKEPDDFVSDLLSTFNLSPPKKPRIAAEGQPVALSPSYAAPVSVLQPVPNTTVAAVPVVPVTVPAEIPVPAAAAEEKALVLYRPVNPPLFPGGPPAGSAELPYQFNASLLRSKALDFSDAIGPIPRRLCGLSSTALARKSSVDDQVMLEDMELMEKKQNMAVIPWVPSFPFAFAAQLSSETAQPMADTDIVEDDGADPMEISF